MGIIIVIVLLCVFVLVYVAIENQKKAADAKLRNAPIGIITVQIPLAYSFLLAPCKFKLISKGIEYEDGTIEVKPIEIIQFSHGTEASKVYALNYLKQNHTLVKKSDIHWETQKPLTIITETELHDLLNNQEVVIQDSKLKLDKQYRYEEIVNLMLK